MVVHPHNKQEHPDAERNGVAAAAADIADNSRVVSPVALDTIEKMMACSLQQHDDAVSRILDWTVIR